MSEAQLLLPAEAWPSKTFPRPPVAHVLTQLAEFLKQIGYAKTVKALDKEAESKGVTVGSQSLATQSGPLKLSLGDLYLDAFMNWPEELEAETKSDTSKSSDDDDSESDSSDDESETSPAPSKPAATTTKRKRDESDSESESSSEDDTSSDESEAPAAKKPKIKEVNSDSESSSSDEDSDSGDDSSSDDEASAKEETTSAATSDSSSDESSDSSDESADSSSDDSSSDDEPTPKPKTKKQVADTASDSSKSSVTLGGSGAENNGGMHPARASRMAPAPAPVKIDKLSEGGKKRVEPFSRIPKDQKVDERFGSNAYVSYDYADRAHNDLIVTKGKGFTKEKNKKKRGSYRGGMIDTTPKGIQFDD